MQEAKKMHMLGGGRRIVREKKYPEKILLLFLSLPLEGYIYGGVNKERPGRRDKSKAVEKQRES